MRPNVPPPPIRLYFSFLLEKEKKENQSFFLFFHVRTALSCIERFFVLYTTGRKTNFLCLVPFFYLEREVLLMMLRSAVRSACKG